MKNGILFTGLISMMGSFCLGASEEEPTHLQTIEQAQTISELFDCTQKEWDKAANAYKKDDTFLSDHKFVVKIGHIYDGLKKNQAYQQRQRYEGSFGKAGWTIMNLLLCGIPELIILEENQTYEKIITYEKHAQLYMKNYEKFRKIE